MIECLFNGGKVKNGIRTIWEKSQYKGVPIERTITDNSNSKNRIIKYKISRTKHNFNSEYELINAIDKEL